MLAAYAGGIVVCVLSGISSLWLIGGCLLAAVVWVAVRRRGWALWFIAGGMGVAGAVISRAPDIDTSTLNHQRSYYSGRVVEVAPGACSQKMIVAVDSVSGREVGGFNVRITLLSALPPITIGDHVRFRGALYQPPYGAAVGDVGMRWYYLRKHISAVAPRVYADDFHLEGYEPGIDTRLDARREQLVRAILRSGLDEDCAELLIAVLTGDRRFLDDGLQEDFRRVGLAHVLALSGMHVAVIAFLISILLFPLRLIGHNRWQWWITLAALWAYGMFTGMSPSVARAVIMATFLLLGRIFRWNTDPLNNMCAAALLILLFRPYDIFSPGFQLTFMAVAAILMFAWLPGRVRNPIVCGCMQWVAVSVSAVVGTAPLAAWHFHTFPLYFLLSNLPVGLLLPIFMVFGLFSTALSSIGSGWNGPLSVTDGSFSLVSDFAAWVASFEGGTVDGIFFPVWLLIPYYIGMVALWRGLVSCRIFYVVNGVALMVFAMLMARMGNDSRQEMAVYPLHYEYATSMLVCQADTAYLYTDATGGGIRGATGYVRMMEDELLSRGIRAVALAYPGLVAEGHECRVGEWVIKGKRYVLLPEYLSVHKYMAKADYVVVGKGFKGSVLDEVSVFSPDTVVLSPTLPPLKCAQLADTLRAASVPYKYIH